MPSSVERKERRLVPASLAVFFQQVASFAAVFGLAIFAVRGREAVPLFSGASDSAVAWYFLSAFAAVTLLFVILLRKVRSSYLFSFLFALAIFTGAGSLFAALFGAPAAVVLTSALVLSYYAVPRVAIYDLAIVVGAAGIAANLGSSMSGPAILVILAFLAFYDIVAVYTTRHMVAMSESLLRRKVFFAMILPETLKGFLIPIKNVTPGGGFVFLGTGDIVLPAMLVASAARYGLAPPLLVAGGAVAGVALLQALFVSQRERRPMPALPPIALGAVAGYAVSLLFT